MKPLVPLVLLLVALPTLADDPVPIDPVRLDPALLGWTRLDFVARKLFMTARSDVEIVEHPSVASQTWMALPEDGMGHVLTPPAGKILEVRVGSSVAGRKSIDGVFFEPRGGAAYQRLKDRLGKKGYRKTSRFTDTGVFKRRQAPADDSERGLDVEAWTKVEEKFFPHPPVNGCPMVSDPSVLFYMFSTLPLDAPVTVCLFSDDRLIPVRIEPRGVEKVNVCFTVDDGTGKDDAGKKERGPEDVDAWRIEVAPVASGDEGELELLGLEGAITVYVEKATRIPVRVDGRIDKLGRVSVQLEGAVLR